MLLVATEWLQSVHSPNMTTWAWIGVQGASEGKLANTGARPVNLLKTCASKEPGRPLPRESLPPGTVSHGDVMHWLNNCLHWPDTKGILPLQGYRVVTLRRVP